MSGEIEAAGAAITAGLAARAIEGGGKGGDAHGACLNCGTALVGAYCHACGQSGHVERKLTHVFEEFLHGIAHFDTKAWRTFPKLVVRPGTLTYEYIRGKRARYVSPLAAFLFVVFLMFFVFALIGGPVQTNSVNAEFTRESLTTELQDRETNLKEAEAQLAQLNAEPSPDAAALKAATERVTKERAAKDDAASLLAAFDQGGADGVQAARAAAKAKKTADIERALAEVKVDLDEARKAGDAGRIAALEGVTVALQAQRDSIDNTESEGWQGAVREAARKGELNVNTGFPELDAKMEKKFENPDLAIYKIQNAVYKFSFLLVPLSLPFLTFLFLFKKDVTLYDHVVFILYSLTFMSLLFLTMVIVGRFAPFAGVPIAVAAVLGPPTHMFFQLKGGYRLRTFSALWRTFVLTIFALICASLFVALMIILGLTG